MVFGSQARSRWLTVAMVGAAAAGLLLFSSAVLGQCSMCRAALAGSNNASFIRNFNIGVLVLLLPPVTIFCCIFVALKRYRTAVDKETEKDVAFSNPESN